MENFESLKEKTLKAMPTEGFLKVSRPKVLPLPSDQKVQLIRKGNELFAAGQYDQAKKIFVSTLYTDGMVRLGDVYASQRDYLSAYQMYKMAPAPAQADAMIQKLTAVLKTWLKEK